MGIIIAMWQGAQPRRRSIFADQALRMAQQFAQLTASVETLFNLTVRLENALSELDSAIGTTTCADERAELRLKAQRLCDALHFPARAPPPRCIPPMSGTDRITGLFKERRDEPDSE
jgi:hypothetical protein